MAVSNSTYGGSCHCGSIGFSYQCSIIPGEWSVRGCQCRFCRSHDALSTSDPGSSIEFFSSDPSQLRRYRFGLKTADFLLCRNCGVYIGAVIETDKGKFGIINTHALVPQPNELAGPAPISYDGEVTGGRISRREERWSPVSGVPW